MYLNKLNFMFKKIILTTIIVSAILILLKPSLVSAGIVPCGTSENPEPCNICHFFQMLKLIIDGTALILGAWAAIYIVIGGIAMLISGGEPEKTNQGKRMITYAIFGVIIAFVAWIIISETMLILVGEGRGTRGVMPWPWNRIECEPTEPIEGGGEVAVGEYCICEVPVYATMDRNISLFIEIKGTNLNTADNCRNNCNSSNAGTYCPDRVTSNNPRLRCANQSSLQTIQTVCTREEATSDSITGACFTDSIACYDAARTTYIRQCMLDNRLICTCTSGLATWCTSSRPIGLQRRIHEVGVGGLFNAWDCVRNCEYSGGYCRLGSLSTPPISIVNWCTRSSSATWPISGINPNQRGDVSGVLANFLDCLYLQPDMDTGHPITSISDNNLCSGTCTFSGATCSSQCQHSCDSAHYGCGPSSSCWGYSYAVDIDITDGSTAEETDVNHAAYTCAQMLWGTTQIKCLGPSNDSANHNNHVHISISWVRGCGCDSIGTNQACRP